MATHSSILAWRILWTEEPGGLQSTGLQRVGHDWSDLTHNTHQFLAQVFLGLLLIHCQSPNSSNSQRFPNPLTFYFLSILRKPHSGTVIFIINILCHNHGFHESSVGKESACNAGDSRLIPGLRRSPGGGNGYPFQCLENPMDRGAWWATVHRVAKSWTWLKGQYALRAVFDYFLAC